MGFPHQNGALSLSSPAERARFAKGVNALRHEVDVDSLVIATCELTGIDEQGLPYTGDDVRIWHYVATLYGGFAIGEEHEGQRFFVTAAFTHHEAHGDQPTQFIVESLCAGIKPDGTTDDVHMVGDTFVDLTTYEYPSGIGDAMMPIANFPVEWRQWLANRAMLLCMTWSSLG